MELIRYADRLVNLSALFLGDIAIDECWKIASIPQGDLTPLLGAYPGLEILRVRGSADLRLRPLRHGALRELTFESNEVPPNVVRAVGASDLPSLRRLELWIGSDEFQEIAGVADLGGVLDGARLPRLQRLGLRNAQNADDIAAALANAAVVPRLSELDLSLGVLTDDGGGRCWPTSRSLTCACWT